MLSMSEAFSRSIEIAAGRKLSKNKRPAAPVVIDL